MNFIKENWIWIVAPVLTVLVVLAVILWVTESGGPADDFTYTLH